MKILVINAGSSSLKYQLIDMENNHVMAKGLCERIGIDGRLKHKANGQEYVADVSMKNHSEAIQYVVEALLSKEHGVISDMSEISAVGHRVVHGGEKFSGSVRITDEVLTVLEDCIALAPLHNPPNLIGIHACEEIMKDVPQVAVFDTAFHQTMPPKAYIYPLPYEFYEKYKVRKYGFHGTSHRYVAEKAAQMMGKKPEELKLVTCHLGNGSSIAAVDQGKVVDTSMGFTPLDGLLMGTRCGSIDPAIVSFIMEKEELTPQQMADVMNKNSGALGVSAISSDFREVGQAAEEGNERAKLTLDILNYGITKYIGAYAAAMGGLDAIVFTAGIGENNINLRKNVIKPLKFLGAQLDEEKNKIRGKATFINTDDSAVKILVVPTDEELMIALDTKEIIQEENKSK
jgi:acetate kinase